MAPAESKPPGAPRRWPGRLRRALHWSERFLAVCGALFLIYHLGFNLSAMSSGSMAPTLQGTDARHGDWVLTEKVSYWFRRPKRWEVVAFRNDEGTQVMKRVAGLPGERVCLRDDRVVVDGAPAACPRKVAHLRYYAYGSLVNGREAPCGAGYFVLGDDSPDSQDSRFEGPVERADIVGRAWLVLWPPSRIGFVNP